MASPAAFLGSKLFAKWLVGAGFQKSTVTAFSHATVVAGHVASIGTPVVLGAAAFRRIRAMTPPGLNIQTAAAAFRSEKSAVGAMAGKILDHAETFHKLAESPLGKKAAHTFTPKDVMASLRPFASHMPQGVQNVFSHMQGSLARGGDAAKHAARQPLSRMSTKAAEGTVQRAVDAAIRSKFNVGAGVSSVVSAIQAGGRRVMGRSAPIAQTAQKPLVDTFQRTRVSGMVIQVTRGLAYKDKLIAARKKRAVEKSRSSYIPAGMPSQYPIPFGLRNIQVK